MKRLILEIHRRSVWQVLGAYVILTWLIFETLEVLAVGVGLPEWVEPTVMVILISLLPAVIATALVQRGGPVRRNRSSPSRPLGAAGSPSGIAGLLTWRNTALGGVFAFGLLVVLTAIYMVMRASGIGPAGTLLAQGTIDERERVILADFESAPDQAELAQLVTEAFRLQLSQSPVVRLHQQRYVSSALVRMERQPDAHLDVALAREVALRESIRAVVGGQVHAVGNRYVLTAQVVSADDGEALVSRRVTASDANEIVAAVDALTRKIRERLGDPLRDIRRAEPLAKVTTSDLDALRFYTQAVRAIDVEGEADRGIALLDEAVDRDSTFSMAWRKLGVALSNRGEQRARYVAAYSRAFDNRQRLTTRERLLTAGSYYYSVTGDYPAAIAAYDSLLSSEPDDPWALNNLGVLYLYMRDSRTALDYFERALVADSLSMLPIINSVLALANLGEADQAAEIVERALARMPDDPTLRQHAADVESARRELAAAQAWLQQLYEDRSSGLYWHAAASLELAALAGAIGQLAVSEGYLREAAGSDAERGQARQALMDALGIVRIDLWTRQDPDAAIARLEQVLDEYPPEELPALDRPSLEIARLYALGGRADEARGWLETFEADVEPAVRGPDDRIQLDRARAALALAEGRAADAIEAAHSSDRGICPICALPVLAAAHEAAGDRDSAVAALDLYVSTPYLWRMREADGWHLAPAHEQLARWYDEAGDTERAVHHYRAFVELWDQSDPELQPRVTAARVRLGVLDPNASDPGRSSRST